MHTLPPSVLASACITPPLRHIHISPSEYFIKDNSQSTFGKLNLKRIVCQDGGAIILCAISKPNFNFANLLITVWKLKERGGNYAGNFTT